MPFKLLVVAELGARDLETGKSTERAKRIRVDRQSFDEVMAAFDLQVDLDVPDRLGESDKPRIVRISLLDLKAFKPDALAAQIPETRELVELRGALLELRAGKRTLADVRGVLESMKTRSNVLDSVRVALQSEGDEPAVAPRAVEPAGKTDGIDALLEKVEAPDGAAGAGPDLARLDALVRQLVSSGAAGERADPKAVRAAIGEIDAAIGDQINVVLHHPELRRLEAAWRGLRLLTDRTEFDGEIKIELLSTGPETMLPLYDQIVHGPESQGVSDEPVSVVIVDRTFENTPEDLDALRALAERGSALSIPVLACAGPTLLGLERTVDLAPKPGLKNVFEGEGHAKWRGLRDYVPSRWLGLIFNRFLLRPEYGPEGRKARTFDFAERIRSDDDRLWGGPAWGLAVLLTRSFARIGWCTDIMGQRAPGTLDDLPVRLYERPGAEQVSFPLETVISDAVERDLSGGGIMALSAALNSDRAALRFAPLVKAPGHYQDPMDKTRAKLQATLPFQMFVSRALLYAMMIEPMLVPGRTDEQIVADYDRALRGLMASAGAVPPDAVRVAVGPAEEDPSQRVLQLKLTWPGFQSLGKAGELTLAWPLRG
jgi:type VI secretion system protein ImpC